jgi:hypothetical protein
MMAICQIGRCPRARLSFLFVGQIIIEKNAGKRVARITTKLLVNDIDESRRKMQRLSGARR